MDVIVLLVAQVMDVRNTSVIDVAKDLQAVRKLRWPQYILIVCYESATVAGEERLEFIAPPAPAPRRNRVVVKSLRAL